MHQVRVDRL